MQEYGELLGLFDDQQKAILARKAKLVFALEDSVRLQLDITQLRRKHREQVAHYLATAIGQRAGISLYALTESCDAMVQPLLQALIHEVNRLAARTKRRRLQNQMLLARSIKVPAEFAAMEACA